MTGYYPLSAATTALISEMWFDKNNPEIRGLQYVIGIVMAVAPGIVEGEKQSREPRNLAATIFGAMHDCHSQFARGEWYKVATHIASVIEAHDGAPEHRRGDIVARLRGWATAARAPLCTEAADKIEHLRSALSTARAEENERCARIVESVRCDGEIGEIDALIRKVALDDAADAIRRAPSPPPREGE